MAEDAAEGLGVEARTDAIGGKGVADGMEIDRPHAALTQR